MISMDELLNHKYKLEDQDQEVQDNLAILLERVNKLRTLWGKPMIVTSGLRSKQDQIRIYNAKGIADESQMHMGSRHFKGAACDIADSDGSLKTFVKSNNYQVLKDCILWMEAEDATNGWLHIQIIAPKSGKLEFEP